MDQDILETWVMTKEMVMEFIIMLMVIYTVEYGNKIYLMGMVYIYTREGIDMRGN